MKNNKKIIKVISSSILSALCFIGSMTSSIFAGKFLYNKFSDNIKKLIDDECYRIDCGYAIYSEIEYEYSNKNISTINNAKKQFDEVLNNQLSKAETEVTISCLDYTSTNNIIMETKSYDTHYDSMHIYSNTTWYYYDENINNVYISLTLESQIIQGTELKHARGQVISITANGITQELTIGGTYLSGTYPHQDTQGKARGDGLLKYVGETILIHEGVLMGFNPSKAFAMFSTDSSNNGEKYEILRETCLKNNFDFNFYINPREGSTLNKDVDIIDNYVAKHKANVGIAVVLIIALVLLEGSSLFLLHVVLKEIDYKNLDKKRKTIFSILFGVSVLLIIICSLVAFKFISFGVISNIKIPALHTISLVLLLIPVVATIIFYCVTQKELIKKLFGEKPNNSEFDY